MSRRLPRPVTVLALAGLVVTAAGGPGFGSGTPEGVGDARPGTAPRVAVDQTYPVPASRRYTVRGHGYGHGRGMSQHGAQGAALAGLSHEEILAFYYPGTRLGTAGKRIRVLITADTTDDLVVAARPGLRLKDRGTGVVHDLPENGADQWRVVARGDNRNAVAYRAGGTWTRWRPGGEEVLTGEGEFRAAGPITLVLPSGTARYRGRLWAAAPAEGSTARDTVNVVGLDGYVKGVVPAEMPASWQPEAVQSQAVAARTYGVWNRSQNPTRAYHLCDTTACQVYRGVGGEHPDGNAAVRATRKQVLRYGGEPAFTQFSASSGGWTAAGSAPYLVAQPDPYDDWSGNTSHDWSTTLTAARIQQAFPALGTLRRIRVTARDGDGQWRGRIQTMVLVGSKASRTISGDTFRFTFGLRSTWLTLG